MSAEDDAKVDLKINASPTKEFFIDILVRDIKLADAIADLVDNCVDGARRLRPDGNYQGLTIDVEFDATHFLITDNCGGISVDTARIYAFRFGRAKGDPATESSIGQFGVGMKRSLFKMGEHFTVESVDPDASFLVDVDVPDWKTKMLPDGREDWEFEFKKLTYASHSIDQCSTIIEVTRLRPTVADEFSSKVFESQLLDVIQSAHEQSIHSGLHIAINNHEIKHRLSTLIASEAIRPLKIKEEYKVADPDDKTKEVTVSVTVYAGVSESNQAEAGWYVVCNGRQVLRADKSKTTGWDDVVNDEKLPKAHNQFSRFRGFVFFESKKAAVLPWNTMKNAVDPESSVFQAAKMQMGTAMRQVIDFLNKVDAETDADATPLTNSIKAGAPQALSLIAASSTFVYPQRTAAPHQPPKDLRITTFSRPVEQVEFARKHFGVTASKAVGEKTFDYFIEREMV